MLQFLSSLDQDTKEAMWYESFGLLFPQLISAGYRALTNIKYPSVKLNTTYCFGIDDYEFVVAFETNSPDDFLDLVQELRETEGSRYVKEDTPIFTCVAMSIEDAVKSLGC